MDKSVEEREAREEEEDRKVLGCLSDGCLFGCLPFGAGVSALLLMFGTITPLFADLLA